MPIRPKYLSAGPFTHMAYSGDPFRNEPGACYLAHNMVPLDPVNGGPYIRRYGDHDFAPTNATTVQWVGVFKRRGGFLNVIIQDGEILSMTVSGGSWSKVVTQANLSTAGITLSTTAIIYAITYNNYLIVNDGVNQPFAWDGASGAGGLTLLSNAPTKCYGAPAVYYGKLFFIKDVAASSVDRSTIVWSEENAINTGYEAGGFTNAWTLEQAGAGPLYAICGTNEALYYFRASSIGSIRGAVTTDFASSGTRDDVSGTLGTISPGGVAHVDRDIWFADTRGYPHYIPPGGEPQPAWHDIADFLLPMNQTTANAPLFRGGDLAALQVTPVAYLRAVMFSYRLLASGVSINHFVYSTQTHRAISQFTFVNNAGRIGELWDDNASRGGVLSVSAGSPGKAIMHPPPDTQTLYNTSATNDSGVGRIFIARPLGVELPSVVWKWKELSIEFDVGGNPSPGNSSITARVGTSEKLTASQSDYADQLGATLSAATSRITLRKTWGIRRELRWLVPRVDALQTDYNIGGWGISRIVCDVEPELAHSRKS